MFVEAVIEIKKIQWLLGKAFGRAYKYATEFDEVVVSTHDACGDALVIDKISVTIRRALVLTSGRADCLPRAFAMHRMLRRRNIQSEIRFCAKRSPFQAHVWVSYAGCCISDTLYDRGNTNYLDLYTELRRRLLKGSN